MNHIQYVHTIGGLMMKTRVVLCFTLLLLFAGCTKEAVDLNVSEILNGDFSSISGTYTNPDGDTVQLDEDGLRWFEQQTGKIHCTENNFCSMGIHVIGEPDGGYQLSIYPVGMEIPHLNTDTSKNRICYGQAEPMSELEIYTYTSNQVDPVVIESEYQAFIMKGYYDVLTENSLDYGLFNPSFNQNTITFTGPYLSSSFDLNSNSYILTLQKSFSYTKDNENKQAEFTIISTIYDNNITFSEGRLTISDGQEFNLSYESYAMQILDKEKNKPITFVKDLHQSLVHAFQDAEIISNLHYQILSIWSDEIEAAANKQKSFDDIINARSIEIQNELRIESMNDFIMTDPCATAIELTRFLMEQRQIQLPEQMSDFNSTQTDESIFWDILAISGFETNEHFPYTHLIHKTNNGAAIFTLEDIQQYAHELFDADFKPYTPDDWSSIYSPELKRYEFEIAFGFENPVTNHIDHLKAEQHGDQVIVTFDVLWLDADADWENDEEMTVWSASSKYILMNENNRQFLRYISTSFSK